MACTQFVVVILWYMHGMIFYTDIPVFIYWCFAICVNIFLESHCVLRLINEHKHIHPVINLARSLTAEVFS